MPCRWLERWVLTRALVCRPRGQGAPVEAFRTALAAGACRVVQATQAAARLGVTVAHGVGVYVPTALAPAAGLGGPREPQRVPKIAIITDLTASPWGREGAVCGGAGLREGAAGSPRQVGGGCEPKQLALTSPCGTERGLQGQGPAQPSAGCVV